MYSVSEATVQTNERAKYSALLDRNFINSDIILTGLVSFYLKIGPAHIIFTIDTTIAIARLLISLKSTRSHLGGRVNMKFPLEHRTVHTVHIIAHHTHVSHRYSKVHLRCLNDKHRFEVKRVDFEHLSKLESILS